MRLLVMADVHGNLHALTAVLTSAEAETVDATVCLGDLVGYGAFPGACLRLLRARASVVLAGNHDRAVTEQHAAAGTRESARGAMAWTRAQLDGEELAYLAGLSGVIVEPSFVAVHGCFLNDSGVSGYVTSTMLEPNLRAIALRDGWPRLALCGHTHVPMCGWLAADGAAHEARAKSGVDWPADARAVLVNPGSVGQPRDGDPRACYALVDTARRSVTWRRVIYDVDAAARAIEKVGLDAELSARLREGR